MTEQKLYTPSLEQARFLYSHAYAWRSADGEGETDLSADRKVMQGEFDRLIAAVRAEAVAELQARIDAVEDFVTRHYLDTAMGGNVLALLSAPAENAGEA